ncbi:unnamed protein product [Rotaria magnacalcarata]
MSTTVNNPNTLILQNVSKQIKDSVILAQIKKILPNIAPRIKRGDPYHQNGEEYQRAFVTFDKLESVDEFMKNRPFSINGHEIKVTRSLPSTCPLFNQSVTGLKIKIDKSSNGQQSNKKLNEYDLKNYCQKFDRVLQCQWTNNDHTEALFIFPDYDSVDRIILCNPSPQIRGIRISLEKTRTAEDNAYCEHPYVIHVTNLPTCVTSEEVSSVFRVPIAKIILYPCYRLERNCVVNGRSSSEAWIKNVGDKQTTQNLAEKISGYFIRTNKIHCEAILEPINEQELCENFRKGICQYSWTQCHYKHYSCYEPDTCKDEYCCFGHNQKRTTISIDRPQYRSEDARYRVKISNLPPHITHDDLVKRLGIPWKFSCQLIVQPTEQNANHPKLAYLIRQPLENKLRQQIDKWHDSSFSSLITQKIQCQLEINQDLFEWSDSNDELLSSDNSHCASPALSTYSTPLNEAEKPPLYSSANSTKSCKPSLAFRTLTGGGKSYAMAAVLPNQRNSSQTKATIRSLRTESVFGNRPPPWNDSSLLEQWHWTRRMLIKDPFDHDELYWVDSESNEDSNVVTKIYLPKTDRLAQLRAQRERLALKKLTQLSSVPKLLESNADRSDNSVNENQEFWNIMKLIEGGRLSDYIKSKRVDFREALHISRQLLSLIKEIHRLKIIHRDIQPKNILIWPRPIPGEFDFMLINFSSSCIIDHKKHLSIQDIDEPLGNSFYLMPQFEKPQNDSDQRVKQFQINPTIDVTGICAILFWLITGREPKECKNIWGQPPHQCHQNLKIIEKKIAEVTAFRMEMKINEHLKNHLLLTFDHCFADPNQQWTLEKVEYELDFMISLLTIDQKQSNYFPNIDYVNNEISSIFITLEDPFVYVISLIHHLKKEFENRYSKLIRWLNIGKGNWRYQDKQIENQDTLDFIYQGKPISIDLIWNVKFSEEQQFLMNLIAKLPKNIDFELPLGTWGRNQQTSGFEVILRFFEIEMKILINILFQSIKT